MYRISNRFQIRMQFGDADMLASPEAINYLRITESIHYVSPLLSFSLRNPHDIITHNSNSDHNTNHISLQIIDLNDIDVGRNYSFVLSSSTPNRLSYDVNAYLKIENLQEPVFNRGFDGTVYDTISQLCGEMGLISPDISENLKYQRVLVQPYWNNISFLEYLRKNIISLNDDMCYYCFVKSTNKTPQLVFKNLSDLYLSNPAYIFVSSDIPTREAIPILDYQAINNYKKLGIYGSRNHTYGYFDYDTGVYISDENIDLLDMPSLSQKYLVDNAEDPSINSGSIYDYYGTSNDFTTDFRGKGGRDYYNRINHLAGLHIKCKDVIGISPGDIIQTIFPMPGSGSASLSYGYNGYWMVEQLIHHIGVEFITELVLIRAGVDVGDSDSGLTSVSRSKLVKYHGDNELSDLNSELIFAGSGASADTPIAPIESDDVVIS